MDPVLEYWKTIKNSKGRTFRDYFLKHKSNEIYENVIKPNEGQYDIDNLDDYFQDNYEEGYTSTNDGESMNRKVKAVKKDKKKRYLLTEIHEFLKDLSNAQENDMEQALRQCGDYELSRSYSHLKISPGTWFSLPDKARKNKISTLLKTNPVRTEEDTKNITELINKNNKASKKKEKSE